MSFKVGFPPALSPFAHVFQVFFVVPGVAFTVGFFILVVVLPGGLLAFFVMLLVGFAPLSVVPFRVSGILLSSPSVYLLAVFLLVLSCVRGDASLAPRSQTILVSLAFRERFQRLFSC